MAKARLAAQWEQVAWLAYCAALPHAGKRVRRLKPDQFNPFQHAKRRRNRPTMKLPKEAVRGVLVGIFGKGAQRQPGRQSPRRVDRP